MTKHVVQMSDELDELLTTLASDTGQTPGDVILTAIKEHLEDLQDIQAAERVLEARANGKLETFSLEEVSRRLGLDR